MKVLIAYYSFMGNTKALCQKIKTEECDLYEIKEFKKRNFFNAFFDCFKAMKGIPSKIHPVNVNISEYDSVILAGPIWGGTIAPALIGFLKEAKLENKNVSIIAVSGNGNDYSEKINQIVSAFGVDCKKIHNVKAGENISIDVAELLA